MSRWAVVGVPDTLRHGGDLRARHLFRELAERTNALVFYRPGLRMLRRAVRHPSSVLPSVDVAAAELLPHASVGLARRLTRLRVLDLHDQPVLQAEAIGLPLSAANRAQQQRLIESNLEAFERVVVVSESFADLSEVPPEKRITIPNGTDTRVIVPGPWPTRPTVGFISGAAPGRGIETLVMAARLARAEVDDLRLKLGLTATGSESESYLAELKRAVANESWIEIASVPYRRLSDYLADTTVLTIPHPPHPYIDSAVPVKLLDSMAAGRPLVVTPRTETARIVTDANAGLVSVSDDPDALASSIVECLSTMSQAAEFGENARRAAEKHFDWTFLSRKLSETVLP